MDISLLRITVRRNEFYLKIPGGRFLNRSLPGIFTLILGYVAWKAMALYGMVLFGINRIKSKNTMTSVWWILTVGCGAFAVFLRT